MARFRQTVMVDVAVTGTLVAAPISVVLNRLWIKQIQTKVKV